MGGRSAAFAPEFTQRSPKGCWSSALLVTGPAVGRAALEFDAAAQNSDQQKWLRKRCFSFRESSR
jgi:hypothetical protein